ncbi:unnamed protein product [Lepeophtheirus salmonis]|uniref:(salmon louse) hypothetical protein n=1 Tax=Lepeophtheirus salmonis TaxID=72036 RepID=A0A7R8HEC3_LEPSM|nr:unnamed protein product [Lepeophtheirus salmonis]CAF3039278.1 unnamed protein product [Lepeophtheirus salmonis]
MRLLRSTLYICFTLQYLFVELVLGENDCTKQDIIVHNKYPYQNKKLKNITECQDFCFKDLRCYHYDYRKDIDLCRLFNVRVDKLSFRDSSNSVTGPKICDDTISVSIHLKGKEILISESYYKERLSISECRNSCLNHPSCKAWTHFDNQCYLYSYPLYIYDLRENRPNFKIFYGVNKKYIGVFHDYGETTSLRNDVCILDLHPENSSRIGACNEDGWIQILQKNEESKTLFVDIPSTQRAITCDNKYITIVGATGRVEQEFKFDISRYISFKCNGQKTCNISKSENLEVELSYKCEPLQFQRFISDPQSFKDILDFGLRQLNITATDKNKKILSASYSTVGNDNGILVFSGFNGSKALDIFDKLKSISDKDSSIYDEIKKGFEFIMQNYLEFLTFPFPLVIRASVLIT